MGLRIWPIIYSVDNGHINYVVDKEQILFQKKGMELSSINITTDNIINIVYRTRQKEFMEDDIDSWLLSFKINVYNDLDQYVQDLTTI